MAAQDCWMVRTWFQDSWLGLELGFRKGWGEALLGTVRVGVRGCLIHYVQVSPHKDRSKRMGVCVSLLGIRQGRFAHRGSHPNPWNTPGVTFRPTPTCEQLLFVTELSGFNGRGHFKPGEAPKFLNEWEEMSEQMLHP